MSLEEKINADYVEAMKARQSERSQALSFLRAQIKNVRIDKRVEKVEDLEIISIINKQIKLRQDSITHFKSGQRPDLAAKEEAEIALYQTYLPPALSAQELSAMVDEVVKSLGAVTIKDMGRVIKEVAAKANGRTDNQTISQRVKERLST